MISLSGNKDTDLLILSKLDDRSLVNLSLTCKFGLHICSNEILWKNKLISKWKIDVLGFKNKDRTYRSFYFCLLKNSIKNTKYIKKEEEETFWNYNAYDAAKNGDNDAVFFFMSRKPISYTTIIFEAAKGGNMELIDFLVSKCQKEKCKPNWNMGMYGAIKGNQKDLIDFFIDKGADDWDSGLKIAIRENSKNLSEFFIEKGRNNYKQALEWAEERDKMELADFFRKRMIEETEREEKEETERELERERDIDLSPEQEDFLKKIELFKFPPLK